MLKRVEQVELFYSAGGSVKWYDHLWSKYKIKHAFSIGPTLN